MVYKKLFFIFNKEYPLMVLLWFYIGGSICTCTCCYMPIFASGDLITSYLIDYMSDHFKIWDSMFQEKTNQDSLSYKISPHSENRYFL